MTVSETRMGQARYTEFMTLSLHDIWQAETKAKANAAFDFFVETYGVKWD